MKIKFYPHSLKNVGLCRIISSLVFTSLVSFSSFAQEAGEANGTDGDEEIITLSPFVVSTAGDTGYRSTNTTSGTALNTPIRDLPMPLEVLNLEFMQDLQATDMKEALEYSAGVFTQSYQSTSTAVSNFNENSPSALGSVNDPFQNAVSIRGYDVPNQQRLGFRVGSVVPGYGVVLGGNTDTITTERTEIVRGPMALLYGVNVLSGIVNMMPKQPQSQFRTHIGLSVGSQDFYRATLDTTGPVVKDVLNYRVMAAYQEQGDPFEVMFREDRRATAAIQFDYKINDKISLFVEYLHSDRKSSGIGSQFLQDDGSGGTSGFAWRNEWGEQVLFGRDDPTASYLDDRGGVWGNPVIEKEGKEYSYPDLGRHYNISGPDTYLTRKENNFLAILRATPVENLNVEVGVYRTELEDEAFNVNLLTFTNTRGPIPPSNAPSNPPFQTNRWLFNPEAAGALNDPYGFGPGEVFAFPQVAEVEISGDYEYNAPTIDPANPGMSDYERKFARYIWYKQPTTADTTQLRGRVTYRIEHDLFDIPMTHNLVGGYHFIQDEVAFVAGSVAANNDNFVYSRHRRNEKGREDQDPVYFRDSVFDYTPLRYNGEILAIPGFRSQNSLGGIPANQLHVARSGWKEATIWHRGLYGIYQGQFWNDRLTVIGGLRRDAYQSKEQEQLIVVDSNRLTDSWVGNTPATVPGFIGYGDQPYVWRDDLPDELNMRVEESIRRIRENQPNGTIEHNFDEYQTFTTGTFGLSWRVVDELSLYYLHSEGVFPNTGQRDGANRAIGSEQTTNNEIGIKFDLLDGKISGTLSFYKIQRKNAVYNWADAPAPARWHGGELAPADEEALGTFSPDAAKSGGSPYLEGRHEPVAYGVAHSYVKAAFEEMGIPMPDEDVLDEASAFSQYGGFDNVELTVNESPVAKREFFVFAEYEDLKNDPNAAPLKRAFDLAVSRALVEDEATGEMIPYVGLPINYGVNREEVNNPSLGRGANILFEEEGEGIDGQVIFSPTPNYQLMFSFSVQERGVSGRGFNLVDPIDSNDPGHGSWGTEYDYWVYILGPENFEDPTRPSTFTGESVRGLDLSFVPKVSFRLWNKYSFSEGPLTGLEIGGGVQYNGSSVTSVPIGGSDLARNQFLTPDTPDRYTLDAMLSYRTEFWGMGWRFNLRVSNLLGDDEDIATAEYTNEYGVPVKRRTVVYYQPRSFRFSITASF